jgi:hypothetical protein
MGPNRSSLDVLCEHMDQCCTASVTLSIFPAVPRRPQEPYDHLNSTVLSGRMTNHCCAVQASLLSDRHSSSFIRETPIPHLSLAASQLSPSRHVLIVPRSNSFRVRQFRLQLSYQRATPGPRNVLCFHAFLLCVNDMRSHAPVYMIRLRQSYSVVPSVFLSASEFESSFLVIHFVEPVRPQGLLLALRAMPPNRTFWRSVDKKLIKRT